MHDGARQMIELDGKGVADERVDFLTQEAAEPQRVRTAIFASWQRSRDLRVAPDKIQLPYVRDPNSDTPLTRSAEPVLERLHNQLSGQSVSIVLTDPAGLVLSRRTGDAELERYLDRVMLAPGFSYAEEFVGTNGIGTAVEAGAAIQVYGHEHFAENLESLACAGVPIHDPVSGRMLGVIDLTCWRKDAHSLLLTLANSTAEQIQQALLAQSGQREFEVLQAYRQTCRRTTGIVFAVTDDALMMNDHARAKLDLADRDALLSGATEGCNGLPAGQRRSLAVALPSGSLARMYCQQVPSDIEGDGAGLVVHVKIGEGDDVHRDKAQAGSRMLLPGLVGDAPLWQRSCRQLEAAFAQGSWLAVEGEPGVGKLALLRAVQLRQQPPRRFTVLDAETAATDRSWPTQLRQALDNTDTLIVTHVDTLDVRGLRSLSDSLDSVKRDEKRAAGREPLWVAVTLKSDSAQRPELTSLLGSFPTTVSVPPLRLRLEDMSSLVSFFLAKLSHTSRVRCSSEAMHLLMRAAWPGNVAQLQQLLQEVVSRRRSGAITAEDLPPEMHSITRRVLSTLESLERDAIVRTLSVTGGNKVRAARSLGMSRATIYRKIREYSIVYPS